MPGIGIAIAIGIKTDDMVAAGGGAPAVDNFIQQSGDNFVQQDSSSLFLTN